MKKKVIIVGISLLISCFLLIKSEPIKNAFAEIIPQYCIGEACPYEYSDIYECLITKRTGAGEYGRDECCKTVTWEFRGCQEGDDL